MKKLLRRLFSFFGIRISRTSGYNRFEAIEDVLSHLRAIGFRPGIVIDGGANVGSWTTMARRYFPEAEFHLVEMQQACLPALNALAASEKRTHVHLIALVEPGVERVGIVGEGTGTGIDLNAGAETDGGIPGKTLDELFARRQSKGPIFLKLDLEGYELRALRGAIELLPRCGFVLLETGFYDIANAGTCTFAELTQRLHESGFDVYDFASLSSRPRDGRLRQGDVLYAKRGLTLTDDVQWD